MAGFHFRLIRWFAPLALVLMTAGAAWAQEDNGGQEEAADAAAGGVTSWAAMFFWSDSILGLIIIWFLLLMSVTTIALVIHFLMQNRKPNLVPDESVEEVEGLLADRKFRDAIEVTENDPSVFGEVMHAALSEASNGYGAMERAVEETADLASARKLRSLEILNVFGAVGPMIGLFGTVYGMIVAFNEIVKAAGKPTPAELAAGISTALVTTFWGLVVGIPAVAAAALIRNKIDAAITEAMIEAENILGRFRPGGSGGAKKATAAKSAGAAKGDKAGPASPQPKPE